MIRAMPLSQSVYDLRRWDADAVSPSRNLLDKQDDQEAREDFRMYAWLEENDLLPAPGHLPSAQAMQAWHEYQQRGAMPATKVCTQCRECKPRTEFYFNGPNRCRSSACIDCARARGRARQAVLRALRKSNGEQ